MSMAWGPVMIGVVGFAAAATGCWVGLMSRVRMPVVALVAIVPLYLVAFVPPIDWRSLVAALMYAITSLGLAYVVRSAMVRTEGTA